MTHLTETEAEKVGAAIRDIMEQVQVFASTYSLAGGRFDDGTKFQQSQEEKDELRRMIAAAISKAILAERERYRWQPIETADKDDEHLMLGIVRQGIMQEIHIGGYRYAYNEDEVSCWWSDQADDEIVPTHWARLVPVDADPKAEG